ncbi:MAG: DISARM system helicase DrmA [Pyrinomonadaceae bacterium]|nr:DISARM system helicase DrmA [Pyrinomonadaceae bacterium]
MAERTELVIDLVKEVLGPRNGSAEILPVNQDPRDEFITGVLSPVDSLPPQDDIESDIDSIVEEEYAEEDNNSDGIIVMPSSVSPALDPKALPHSLGISFTVETDDNMPEIEICSTWARYNLVPQGWQRHPSVFHSGLISAQNQQLSAADGVTIQIRSQELQPNVWRVSVFLINTTTILNNQRASTQEHIFQPQIRINCGKGSRLLPVRSSVFNNTANLNSMEMEENSLSLLYRNYPAFARGHLCAAMWREIDPERPHNSVTSPNEPPFFWVDGNLVTTALQNRFSPPDIRTELVPCYPIEAPFMEWDSSLPSPELNPEILAELWSPSEIRDALIPLLNGYQLWLQAQFNEASTLNPEQQDTAFHHLHQCNRVQNRLSEAIELIASDDNVRLAFNFANKAIATQSRWKGRSINWRPFQLAFILINIPALNTPSHPDRNVCDLLWFPTGGGKTEAYLGLAAFTIALRRRKAISLGTSNFGAGVSVISRYTLRLLTIQQFRRALNLVTACEFLRVDGLNNPSSPVGWRPQTCTKTDSFLWGGFRFSIGLWVGGNVTPNSLNSIGPIPTPNLKLFAGALDILQGIVSGYGYNGSNPQLTRRRLNGIQIEAEGEPAQVLTCPCCDSVLAIPKDGFDSGQHTIYFIYSSRQVQSHPPLTSFIPTGTTIIINNIQIERHNISDFYTLAITFTIPLNENFEADSVDSWWYSNISGLLGNDVQLIPARPSRPGYFILGYSTSQNTFQNCDFDIYCPNPDCELNQRAWAEQIPRRRDNGATGGSTGFPATTETAALPLVNNLQWQTIPDCFRYRVNVNRIAGRIPIPALTVDDQIYHRCPSLLIATVDKFARLAFEPKAASIFGNVDHYHSRWGYYREGCPPSTNSNLPQSYAAHPAVANARTAVTSFEPPELILQDELHLIEGPLGSMVGIYETVFDELSSHGSGRSRTVPKYIASTATVRQAEAQTSALFNRQLFQFPAPGISINDRFFAREANIHPLDCHRPGRLYVAICAPGKGAQTPNVRIWSVLLQKGYENWLRNPNLYTDSFYTVVGYFNATRELAGAISLYRQDIPERIEFRWGTTRRLINPDHLVELSGRANSLALPSILKGLENNAPQAEDAVFATSMFGTGVDIDRLSLMIVNGQPKTTASYIQATGRVGRRSGGLVVAFFRASRPRDLDHYEFFTGYHQSLYRYVEPVTVAPFSPRARERAIGPLIVSLLRNASYINNLRVHADWRIQQRLSGQFYCLANRMRDHRFDLEVTELQNLFETRAQQQPIGRRPLSNTTAVEVNSEIDLWQHLASLHYNTDAFVYSESSLIRVPQRHVVLGDAHHRQAGLSEAYENAPQSLREVEETTGFQT